MVVGGGGVNGGVVRGGGLAEGYSGTGRGLLTGRGVFPLYAFLSCMSC